MKGLDSLKALRLNGLAPAAVTVLIGTSHVLDADELGHFVSMSADEKLDRMDLRPFVGLKVVVHGPRGSALAVKDACDAIVKAKPLAVLGFATDRPKCEPEALVFAQGDFAWL